MTLSLAKLKKAQQKEKQNVQAHLQSKFVDPEDVSAWANRMRKQGKTIATLNGSFDLLHAGHLTMLLEGSQQAEVFIVALNSDSSIKRYKGDKRPIVSLENRLLMMAALEMVDYITWFDEDTPINLLDQIKPDVHVNGAEWGKDCIESGIVRKNGGRVHIVKLVPGLSTSEIIAKIHETS